MNQILQVQEKKNKKTSKPIDTKKIVLFFAICIIIFGLVMLGQGAYSAYQNKANEKVNLPEPSEPEYIPPTIGFTRTADNKAIINIQSEVAISHIIYDWNNESSQTLEEAGKTNIEEVIDIPVGENTLNIKVIDSEGRETKKSEIYIVEASKPIIEVIFTGANDLKVIVTSEEELSYVTCKWNSEKEQKYDMITFENRTKFDKILEIPKGQNTLKIIAVDIKNNQSESSMSIKGVPPAKVPTPIARDGYIYFSVISEDEYNIELVEFELNGDKKIMNTDTFGKTKEVDWRVKMVEGWNYLKITTKLEGADKTDSTYWKFEYKPQ